MVAYVFRHPMEAPGNVQCANWLTRLMMPMPEEVISPEHLADILNFNDFICKVLTTLDRDSVRRISTKNPRKPVFLHGGRSDAHQRLARLQRGVNRRRLFHV